MPSKKITLLLEGLDCASCANKIEAEVNQINGVVKASVNFVSIKLEVYI